MTPQQASLSGVIICPAYGRGQRLRVNSITTGFYYKPAKREESNRNGLRPGWMRSNPTDQIEASGFGPPIPRSRYNACMGSGADQDPRVYFAAERTFLAWIRTGLGLIGIGFAVSRFSLFLREISGNQSHASAHARGLSLWSGILLVALGVVVILSSVVRHIQLVRALKAGTWESGKVSRQGVALGLILAAAGIGMCLYLVLAR